MKYILIAIIKLYQLTLSKILPPCCRFYPSCSRYGAAAISRFGAVRGGCLTIKRIARCNPFSAGGYDPVPEEFRFFKRGASDITRLKKETACINGGNRTKKG